jgi:hypothetical protein
MQESCVAIPLTNYGKTKFGLQHKERKKMLMDPKT